MVERSVSLSEPTDQLALLLAERFDAYGRTVRERLDRVDTRVDDVQQCLHGQIATQRRSMVRAVVLLAAATNLGFVAITVGAVLWLT
jgi:hypothetical protein